MKNKKAIIALTSVLLVLTFMLGACGGSSFDYKADSAQNVKLDASVYTNAKIEVGLEPVVDAAMVAKQIATNATGIWKYDNARYEDPTATTKKDNPNYAKDSAIPDHALVFLRYHGVTVEDGKAFKGGSNITATAPTALLIGSGTFVEGFEDQLIGLKPSDTSLDIVKNKEIKEDSVIYVTSKATYIKKGEGTDAKDTTESYSKLTFTNERIDLAQDEEIANIIREKAIEAGLGKEFTVELPVEISETEYTVTVKATANYLAKEAAVRVTFPEDYNDADLQGKEAIFYVVLDGYLTFDTVATKLGDNGEEYKAEEGKELFASYEAKIKKDLEEQYAKNIVANRRNAIWDYLMSKAEIKAPFDVIASVRDEAEENWHYTYENGSYYGIIAYKDLYESFEKMMQANYGKEWEDALYEECENSVKERMLINAMAARLSLSVTEAEINAEIAAHEKDNLEYGEYYGEDEYRTAIREALLWEKITEKLDNKAYIEVVEVEEKKEEKESSSESATEGETEVETEIETETESATAA